jgi:hypothetical protein
VVAKTVGVMLAVSIAIQAPKPSIDDWRWLAQFREAAFDKLMPIEAKPLVAYRSFRDLYGSGALLCYRLRGGFGIRQG